jgi:hypothetical protein
MAVCGAQTENLPERLRNAGLGLGSRRLSGAAREYHLHAYLPYWLPSRAGPADNTVAVVPGQLVELEYKAPLFTFSRGSLGPPPQRYTGVAATIAVVVALLIFLVAWILLLALL